MRTFWIMSLVIIVALAVAGVAGAASGDKAAPEPAKSGSTFTYEVKQAEPSVTAATKGEDGEATVAANTGETKVFTYSATAGPKTETGDPALERDADQAGAVDGPSGPEAQPEDGSLAPKDGGDAKQKKSGADVAE
jgi:hypothetical protein